MKKLLLLNLMLLVMGWTINAQTAIAPSSGDGSTTNPYQIASLENLYWISANPSSWDKHFIQTADIDATATSTWNSGAGFSPLGNSTTKFTGKYNGDGHIIKGLTINRPSSLQQGMFGIAGANNDGTWAPAILEKIGLVNVNIKGNALTGGLVANPQWGTSISHSFVTGRVIGDQYTGGLVGYAGMTSVSECYATCEVIGTSVGVGGLVGYSFSNSSITDSYATGKVSGNGAVGGLVGENQESAITNSYSTGQVAGNFETGGLVARNSGTVTLSFWDTQTSLQPTSAGGTGKTTAEMKTQSTFTGWDFETIWGILEPTSNDCKMSYPYLLNIHQVPEPGLEEQQNPSSGGTIAANPTSVSSGTVSIEFSNSAPASGQIGVLQYQWQMSTDNSEFVDIDGAVSESFTFNGTLIQDTWFRRLAKVTCQTEWVVSNTVVITICSTPLPTADAQTFCSGDDATVNDLAVTALEGAVIAWYDVESGGSPLAGTTTLVTGLYYLSQTVDNCESERTAVVVTVKTPSVPGEIFGPATVCAGGININYWVTAVQGATSYNWTLPEGTEITSGSGTNSITVTFGSTSGTVSVTASNSCGTSLPGTLEVTVNTELTPSVTITSNDSDNKICYGAQVDPIFTAYPADTDGGIVSYQWYLNELTSSFWKNEAWSYPDFVTGDKVHCEITVTKGTCTVKAVSNIIRIEVYNESEPSVTIESSVSGTFCYGTPVNFTATPVSGGGTVAYQWKWNDKLVGSNQNMYTSTELVNGDRFSCDITVTDAACFSEAKTASSNEITVSVYEQPVAGIINGTSELCRGNTVTFSVTGNSISGSWLSSNESVATVDQSGNVTAVDAGSATIGYLVSTTDPCTDSDEAIFDVTVHQFIARITGFTEIGINGITYLSPSTGGTWSSSNPAIATVTDEGVVTGIAAGTATFTYTDATSGCSATTGELTVKTEIDCITPVATAPAAGDGSEENPYQIATIENLYWIKTNSSAWDKYFIQTADIDASSTAEWCNGGWSPIGYSDNFNFIIHYNGNNHIISGLHINSTSGTAAGLFGAASASEFKNLGITDVYIDAVNADRVGALVGWAVFDVQIDNCYSTGVVKGHNYCGGLAGYLDNYGSGTTIRNSYSTCNVSGDDFVGGLVGYSNYNVSVLNCYQIDGIVEGNKVSGGLIGYAFATMISKCYSTGNVTGNSGDGTGGLVGFIFTSAIYNSYSRCKITNTSTTLSCGGLVGYSSSQIDYPSIITNCYSTGPVQAGMGGLVGRLDTYGITTITNSFWDTETSGTTTSAGGTGKPTILMKMESTFTDAGWDFENVWGIFHSCNYGYPYLRQENLRIPLVTITSNVTGEICSGINPIFTATPYNTGGGNVSYSWKLNGNSVGLNQNPYTLIDAIPGYAYEVSCEITVTDPASCASATATSEKITITVAPLPDAGIISVAGEGDNVIQVGEQITLSSSIPGGMWVCKETDIASVDLYTGQVTGLKAGTATINYYREGIESTCYEYGVSEFTITVTAAPEINTQTFTSSGQFTIPIDVYTLNVKAWGGGGGGSGRNFLNPIYVGGSGGGGGGFCGGTLHVSPGEVISITVGQGGSGGGGYGVVGSNSVISGVLGTITAYGGWPGQLYGKGGPGKGGTYTGTVENVKIFAGGDGYTAVSNSAGTYAVGGGGGGGAGDNQNGGHANLWNGGGGGTALGGNGGNGNSTASGEPGSAYGGGGAGGSYMEGFLGGNGANGAVIIEWTVTTPLSTITVTPTTLSGFTYVEGSGPSVNKSFTITGLNLTSDVTITPSANYEISREADPAFTPESSIGFSFDHFNKGGSQIIYVRLKAGLTAGNYNEEITISSTGANPKTVTCSGTVIGLPSLTVSPTSLSGLTYVEGSGPSDIQSFNVGAANLTHNLIILSTTTHFEISASYSPFVPEDVIQIAPHIMNAATLKTFFVRLKAGLTAGNYNTVIDISSEGAESKFVSCSGEVPSSSLYFSEHPSTASQTICLGFAATTLSVTAIGSGTLDYQWYSNTAQSNAGGVEIGGATGSSYTPSTAVAGELYYYVEVSDADGNSFTSNVSGAVIVKGYSGGDGSEGNPFLIATLNDLQFLSENNCHWDKHFKQTANIDASATSDWNDWAGFGPIGNRTNRFTGSYDGQGYYIKNLTIERFDYYDDGLGMFGGTSNAKLERIGLIDISIISDRSYVGGLVGEASNTEIHNSHVTGQVTGGAFVGGLVGCLYSGSTIDESYTTCNVTGSDNVGGLVGINQINSSITNSYATGNVSGSFVVGGLVGYNSYLCNISKSYSTGSVSGTTNIGGLVGINDGGIVTNSFWDKETSLQTTSAGGTGKTTAEMKTQSTFTDWDFSTIWGIDEGISYPYLNPSSSCSDGTIALTSGTANQTICVISFFTPVVYTIGGGATGASFSETTVLPGGLSGVYNSSSKTFTISGIPTESGVFPYTVITTGTQSPCNEMSASGTITVKALPFATFDTPPSNSPVCSGGDARFYVTATPGSRLFYRIGGYPDDELSDIDASGKTVITVSNVTANITVTLLSVQYPDGLCPVSINKSSTVVVNPQPTLSSITVDNAESCYGTDVTVTIDGLVAGPNTINYDLSSDGGDAINHDLDITASEEGVYSFEPFTLPAGNHTLTIKSIKLGTLAEGEADTRCSINEFAENSVSWTVNSCCTNPTDGGEISGNQIICSGSDPAAFTSITEASGNTGTLEYKWQYSDINDPYDWEDLSESNSAGFNDDQILNSARWYRRLARVDCSADWTAAAESNIITATVDEVDAGIMVYGPTTFCEGGSVTLAALGGNSWLWSNGEITQEIVVTTSDNYFVTITNENGCSASTSPLSVTVNPKPTFSGVSVDNESSCFNPDVNPILTFSKLLPGENIIFYAINEEHINEPLTLVADENGIATHSFDLGVGTFIFSIDEIRVNGGCKANPVENNTVTWTVFANPTANANSRGDACGLDFVLNATPSVGTGTWTQESGAGTAGFSPNSNDPDATVTVDAYGSYLFRWTENNGPCSDFAEVTVNFYQPYEAIAGFDQAQCNNSVFTISAGSLTKAAIIGPSGIWEFVGEYGEAIITDKYSETTTVTNVPFDQDITLRWTLTNGTCSDFDEVVLRNNSLPTVDAGSFNDVCVDAGKVTLIGFPTGGVWSGTGVSGNQTDGYVFDPTGHVGYNTLTYIYTDGNFCSNSDQTTIHVNYLPDCLFYEPGSTDGDPVLPNSKHFYTTHVSGIFKWTIEGNGRINGYDNKVQVEVIAGENCNEPYTLSLTVTNIVTHCSSTCSKEINVNDTEAPFLVDDEVTPANLNISGVNECLNVAEDWSAVQLEASVAALYKDNCDTEVSATLTGEPVPGTNNSDCAWSFTYTFIVADNCGNKVTCDVTRSGGDTENPQWAQTMPADITVECDEVPSVATIYATDNCDTYVEIQFTEDRTDGACLNSYTLTRKWTATDNCLLSITHTQVITVQDTEAPYLIVPTTITAEYDPSKSGALVQYVVTANDDCSGPVSPTIKAGSLPNGSVFPFGTTNVTWEAEDACGNRSEKSFDVIVNPATTNTSITVESLPDASEPVSQQYSDLVKLKVVIENGFSLNGEEAATGVNFYIAGQLMNDAPVTFTQIGETTDMAAEITVPLLEPQPDAVSGEGSMQPGVKTVRAVLVGINDALYNISDPADKNLIITQEHALTEYTGQEFVGEQNPDVTTTPLILSASVTDINDGYRGDIRNARVQFYDVNTLVPISGWLTPGLVDPTDFTQGLVMYIWDAPVPVTGYNTFTIGVKVGTQNPEDNGYYVGSDKSVVNVYRTDLYEFITGGGHIIPTDSRGTYASDPGRKVNFGFNVKWNKTMKRLQGNLNLVFRIGAETYQVKTNSMTSLSINSVNPCSQQAYFTSKANLTRVTSAGIPEEIKGNLDLQVTMTNNTSPGAISTIGVTVYDGNTLLYSSNWPVNQTEELPLEGGNIVVHNGITCVVNNQVDVMLYSSKNPSFVGEEVIFEAVVTPKGSSLVPEGEIVFRDNEVVLGTVTMIGGKATLTVGRLDEGDHPVVAEYIPFDYFIGVESNTLIQRVEGAVIQLESNKNPSIEGETVTFTATIIGPPGGETPTGTIAFADNGVELDKVSLIDGKASIVSSNLSAGSHTITAEYSGDLNYDLMTAEIIQAVNSNVVIQLSSSKNPEQVNNTVTFIATVTSSGIPVASADVSFYVNGKELVKASTDGNGVAKADKTFTVTGTYLIEASCVGQTASLSQVIKNKVKSAVLATAIETGFKPADLKVYPNPFSDRLNFEFVSPADDHVRIDIYDLSSRRIETVFDNMVKAGVTYNAVLIPDKIISGIYIYRTVIGDNVYNGKVIFNGK